jgi:type II secretory pathway pseudopilin PulG
MKKQQGFGALGIVLVVLVIGIVAGAGYFVMSKSGDKADDSSSSSSSSADKKSDEKAKESKDVAITKSYELNIVCEQTGWASNVTKSASGKATMVFEERPTAAGEYSQLVFSQDKATRPNSDKQTEIDRVACLGIGKETGSVTCTFSKTTATMLQKEYNLVVYDIHTKEKVGSKTVAADSKCPSSAVVKDGKFNADPDEAEVNKALLAI